MERDYLAASDKPVLIRLHLKVVEFVNQSECHDVIPKTRLSETFRKIPKQLKIFGALFAETHAYTKLKSFLANSFGGLATGEILAER